MLEKLINWNYTVTLGEYSVKSEVFMEKLKEDNSYFGTERISRILLKIAPPVMLAQLIQGR